LSGDFGELLFHSSIVLMTVEWHPVLRSRDQNYLIEKFLRQVTKTYADAQGRGMVPAPGLITTTTEIPME